jgi:hypothetical protein
VGAIIAVLAVPGSAGALLTLGVTTKSPRDVAARSVTLSAEATVSVLGASVVWQYGTTSAYGSTTGSVSTSLLGVKETLTLPLAGLTPDTTYHVRAVATSGLNTAYGADVKFNTDKAPKGSDDGTTTPGTAPSGGSSGDDSGGGSGSGSDDDSGSSGGGSGSGPSSGDGKTPSSSGSSTSSSGKTGGDDRSGSGSGSSADDDGVDTPPSADPAADVPRGQATANVTPVLGKTLAVAAVQGTVKATSPSGAPVDLSDARAVPNGTVIDTRAGTVELTSALDTKGATQTARFWGGLFEVRQSATDRGLTQLVLRGGDFSICGNGTVARAAASKQRAKKKKPSRSLWGSDDHGRFQTHGRGSVATVRGTRWLTQDTCAGTLTRVAAGAVAVKDLRTRRTVLVRKGHQYRARVAP